MRRLDRAGIFRARPLSWRMRNSRDSSQAVAVSMEFLILEQLDESEVGQLVRVRGAQRLRRLLRREEGRVGQRDDRRAAR